MKILGLIPARGGSKVLPGKNVMKFAGKPLIAWTIDASKESGILDRVIVSTDCPEIARISREYGAETPFMRPEELSRDHSPAMPFIIHALKWMMENENYAPDCLMLLQPTSPLRNSQDIVNSVDLMRREGSDSVISVCEPAVHPYHSKQINDEGYIDNLVGRSENVPRQKLPKAYILNGAIYLVRTTVLIDKETLYPPKTSAYIMPQERSIDIDNEIDFRIAEFIAREIIPK